MKSYLPLEKAAVIASRSVGDMTLLCEANRIDCRKTDNGWFVAEEEIVNTLSMMNGAVLDAELKDLRRMTDHQISLARLESSAKRLVKATVMILVLLFGTMAVLAWGVNIAENGNLTNSLAAIFESWR